MESVGVELCALFIMNMAPYSFVLSCSCLVGLTSKTRSPHDYWIGDWMVPHALIFSVPSHRNQVIYNVTCRLLEKSRNQKNGSGLKMESHKGFQKKGRNPVPCNKNSEFSTEPESLQ